MKSLEPLKGFQECQHVLPAHFLLNAYFGCLLSTECARQAFVQREKVFWASERGRHSLSDVNGEIQEVGNSGRVRRALQEGMNEKPKEKEMASTSL